MQSAFSISTPTVNACTLLWESNKQTFALLHFPLAKLFNPSGAGCASWCAALAPGQIKSDLTGQQCSLPTRRRLTRIMRTKKKMFIIKHWLTRGPRDLTTCPNQVGTMRLNALLTLVTFMGLYLDSICLRVIFPNLPAFPKKVETLFSSGGILAKHGGNHFSTWGKWLP